MNQNFTGCIENFHLNKTNVFRDLAETEYTGENLRYDQVNTPKSCPEPPIIPVTFLTTRAQARVKGYEGVSSLNVSLAFRSYKESGVILSHNFQKPGHVKVKYVCENKLLTNWQVNQNFNKQAENSIFSFEMNSLISFIRSKVTNFGYFFYYIL